MCVLWLTVVLLASVTSGSPVVIKFEENRKFTVVEDSEKLTELPFDAEGYARKLLEESNLAEKERGDAGRPTGGSCQDSWLSFGKACYKLISVVPTNVSAERENFIKKGCGALSGVSSAQAVSIHSKEENDFLFANGNKEHNLIGLVAPKEVPSPKPESFKWTDGTPLDYKNWQMAEPFAWENPIRHFVYLETENEWSNYPHPWNSTEKPRKLWCSYRRS
uniref:C-type lectin domain-containing protein n=1 Tax=Steinernema glaseri TaxID=37863 RepID=A0A1I7YAR3_9BILA